MDNRIQSKRVQAIQMWGGAGTKRQKKGGSTTQVEEEEQLVLRLEGETGGGQGSSSDVPDITNTDAEDEIVDPGHQGQQEEIQENSINAQALSSDELLERRVNAIDIQLRIRINRLRLQHENRLNQINREIAIIRQRLEEGVNISQNTSQPEANRMLGILGRNARIRNNRPNYGYTQDGLPTIREIDAQIQEESIAEEAEMRFGIESLNDEDDDTQRIEDQMRILEMEDEAEEQEISFQIKCQELEDKAEEEKIMLKINN